MGGGATRRASRHGHAPLSCTTTYAAKSAIFLQITAPLTTSPHPPVNQPPHTHALSPQDNGASVYCHWFQPLGASGVRHGQSAQVQNTMMEFDKAGKPVWDFKGKNILKGETDGSSYPNGGLRATHRAGAYLSVDPTSPIFLRGDTIFIPACLVSYYGHALDEKTPLLRASDALSREGVRLLGHLGYKAKKLQANIGLEQEIFLVPRSAYFKRPDLQFSGRTVMGRLPPRGQEMCDHYMAPPSLTSSALA